MRSILRSTIGVAENVRRSKEKREEEVVLHVVGRKLRVPSFSLDQVQPQELLGKRLIGTFQIGGRLGDSWSTYLSLSLCQVGSKLPALSNYGVYDWLPRFLYSTSWGPDVSHFSSRS